MQKLASPSKSELLGSIPLADVSFFFCDFGEKNDRIEALMFVYFLAQLLCSLLERQLKKEMEKREIREIQILPEERPSASPTAEQVMRVFHPCARHVLLSKHGTPVQAFADPLSRIQKQILELLAISPSAYA
jgi:hypothetical protein